MAVVQAARNAVIQPARAQPPATIYNRIRIARAVMRAALAREAAKRR